MFERDIHQGLQLLSIQFNFNQLFHPQVEKQSTIESSPFDIEIKMDRSVDNVQESQSHLSKELMILRVDNLLISLRSEHDPTRNP